MSDIKERLIHRALRTVPRDLCADLLIAAGTIEELEEKNKELLLALRKIWNMAVPVQKEEHRIAREAIAKAKGEE